MGQQQLILLVLVFIIVGIATVVAIDRFSGAQNSAASDAARVDILNAISNAQKYYSTPEAMGGGGQSYDGITFNDLSMDSVNTNASYSLNASGNTLIITAVNAPYNLNVRATVTNSGSSTPAVTWEDL